MNDIICPSCKKAFKVDEAGFAAILKQVRDHQFEEELQKIKLLSNKIGFDEVKGKIEYEEIKNNTNLKFYKNGKSVMSLSGDWNQETEELDTIIDIDGETVELNYHPLDSMGGINMQQLKKNIDEAFKELNTYSAVVSIEGYEDRAVMVRGSSQVVSEMFEDDCFDFVYIDANHAYDFVIQDIELWYPKVKKGGGQILIKQDF